MSTALDIEIEYLADIDLDSTPSCDAMCRGWLFDEPCNVPSAARVSVTCRVHGRRVRFVCTGHLVALQDERLVCGWCRDEQVEQVLSYNGLT